MKHLKLPSSVLLAELLRIQRWAGGDSVDASRIFGLMNGFESVINEELEDFGISEAIQSKVEDILEEIDSGEQSVDGMSLKTRLREERISEHAAGLVIELCRLQGRFIDAVDKLRNTDGSPFSNSNTPPPEHDWHGATHYMELVDCSTAERHKLHAVFGSTVPRVGEIVIPEAGSPMRVVAVEHVVTTQGVADGLPKHILMPYVLLKEIDD